MAISLEPSYVPIIQKPKCCAAACLQMILYRNGYGLFDQEDIAIEFGIKVGKEDKDAFRENMSTMTGFNLDEGMPTTESADHINHFLSNKNISLQVQNFRYSDISDLTHFISDNITKNNDIWVEYHTHEMYEASGKIHDGLIESIDPLAKTIVLIDPKPTRRQRNTVSIDLLARSLSDIHGKELGLTIVSKKS